MKAPAARRECKRLLNAMVGPGGYEAFLKARQPALEDRTGDDLMKRSPKALLDRLRTLEAQLKRGEG
jgi:hypothetical protein